MYDLRKPVPVYSLHHHYRLPINSIEFHTPSRSILTADAKIVKIHKQETGELFTNIEPKAAVNSV